MSNRIPIQTSFVPVQNEATASSENERHKRAVPRPTPLAADQRQIVSEGVAVVGHRALRLQAPTKLPGKY